MTRAGYHRDMAALMKMLADGFIEAPLTVNKHCGDSAVVAGAGACFAAARAAMQELAGR